MPHLSSRSKLKLTRLFSVVKPKIILSCFISFIKSYEHTEIIRCYKSWSFAWLSNLSSTHKCVPLGKTHYRITTACVQSDPSVSTIPQLSNSTHLQKTFFSLQVNFIWVGHWDTKGWHEIPTGISYLLGISP